MKSFLEKASVGYEYELVYNDFLRTAVPLDIDIDYLVLLVIFLSFFRTWKRSSWIEIFSASLPSSARSRPLLGAAVVGTGFWLKALALDLCLRRGWTRGWVCISQDRCERRLALYESGGRKV